VQVLHERGDGPIEERHVLPASLKVLPVVVPAAEIQGDYAGTRFDQPAGNEKFSVSFGAVVGNWVSLAVPSTSFWSSPEMSRARQGRRDAEGLLRERVEAHRGCIALAAEPSNEVSN
jgi:hypothetical protein